MKVKAIVSGCDLTKGKIYDVITEYDTVYDLQCDTGRYCVNKSFFEICNENETINTSTDCICYRCVNPQCERTHCESYSNEHCRYDLGIKTVCIKKECKYYKSEDLKMSAREMRIQIDDIFKKCIIDIFMAKSEEFASDIIENVIGIFGFGEGFNEKNFKPWLNEVVQTYFNDYYPIYELTLGDFILDCMIEDDVLIVEKDSDLNIYRGED